ncbi:hypothetical protein DYBT9275_02708 [Dyadobacter sp. CECT 9275]|uniref:Uncharacterized protein n=1 Tax=Dyadobacter helix TaxID=2822344 RepID=A0A916JDJ5_9BACT|nr:hypothetical protein DYBT9275_02708 [Dyadobacter sp. CECT 9275]
MTNKIPVGLVKKMMISSQESRQDLKQRLKTHEGRLESLYEMLADGDITDDQFNHFYAISLRGSNSSSPKF